MELVHLLLNIGTSCMAIVYTAVEYLKAGRQCSIIRFCIYINLCRLWMYVVTVMWQIQWSSSAISRISRGQNSSGFGDNLCLCYQDFFPKKTALWWTLNSMYKRGGFCEKINLTVHANRLIFSFKPKGKKEVLPVLSAITCSQNTSTGSAYTHYPNCTVAPHLSYCWQQELSPKFWSFILQWRDWYSIASGF
jgi:hypothetical protein